MPDGATLDEIFSALAHSRRRVITLLIARSETQTVAQVVARLRLSQGAVSKHLLRLRQAGLISCEKHAGQLVRRRSRAALDILDAWFAHALGDPPDPDVNSLPVDQLFHLLSDSGRRRLLEQLARHLGSTVGELAARAQLRPDAASRKLKALAMAGCVHTERRGREIVCQLNAAAIVAAWDWVWAARRRRLAASTRPTHLPRTCGPAAFATVIAVEIGSR